MGSFVLDLLDFIVLVFFLLAMARKIRALFGPPQSHVRTSRGRRSAPPSAEPSHREMGRDPVCGMFVATELSQKLREDGKTLHFCSRQCMEKYQKGAHDVAS